MTSGKIVRAIATCSDYDMRYKRGLTDPEKSRALLNWVLGEYSSVRQISGELARVLERIGMGFRGDMDELDGLARGKSMGMPWRFSYRCYELGVEITGPEGFKLSVNRPTVDLSGVFIKVDFGPKGSPERAETIHDAWVRLGIDPVIEYVSEAQEPAIA